MSLRMRHYAYDLNVVSCLSANDPRSYLPRFIKISNKNLISLLKMQKGKSSIIDNRFLDDTHSNAIYTATLKGKINGLEETVKALTEELTFYKNEIGNLRSEKNDLE